MCDAFFYCYLYIISHQRIFISWWKYNRNIISIITEKENNLLTILVYFVEQRTMKEVTECLVRHDCVNVVTRHTHGRRVTPEVNVDVAQSDRLVRLATRARIVAIILSLT